MKPLCDICGQEMEFKERVKSKKPYRIIRYFCELCNHQQTIYADGYRDLVVEQIWAKEDVEKMFKQEKENRDQLLN